MKKTIMTLGIASACALGSAYSGEGNNPQNNPFAPGGAQNPNGGASVYIHLQQPQHAQPYTGHPPQYGYPPQPHAGYGASYGQPGGGYGQPLDGYNPQNQPYPGVHYGQPYGQQHPYAYPLASQNIPSVAFQQPQQPPLPPLPPTPQAQQVQQQVKKSSPPLVKSLNAKDFKDIYLEDYYKTEHGSNPNQPYGRVLTHAHYVLTGVSPLKPRKFDWSEFPQLEAAQDALNKNALKVSAPNSARLAEVTDLVGVFLKGRNIQEVINDDIYSDIAIQTFKALRISDVDYDERPGVVARAIGNDLCNFTGATRQVIIDKVFSPLGYKVRLQMMGKFPKLENNFDL